MEITEAGANGIAFQSQNAGAASGSVPLAETFDNFLTLLTTQLQHQDPLSPVDTTQFTEQLVQFTGVEQALRTNDKLDQLIALQGGSRLGEAVSYIGKEVTAESVMLMLQNGQAKITYELEAGAEETSILIVDEQGTTVRSLDGETARGPHELLWDGIDDNGGALPDGLYGFLVTASDGEGNPVALRQGTGGVVTSVRIDGESVLLSVGELELNIDEIQGVGLVTAPDTGM